MAENEGGGLDIKTVLKIGQKINKMIYAKRYSVEDTFLAFNKAFIDSLAPYVLDGRKLELRNDWKRDFHQTLNKQYKNWKDDEILLQQIAIKFFNRLISDNKKNLKDNVELTMALKVTQDIFISYCKNSNVLADAQMSAEPSPDYKMVLFAQACMETGNFTSRRYKDDGNMFGMMASSTRKRIYVSSYLGNEGNGNNQGKWPQYKDQSQSLSDRLNWDVYNRIVFIDTMQYMKQVLGDNQNHLKYATDPEYMKKWVGWIYTVYDNAGMLRPYIKGVSDISPTGGPTVTTKPGADTTTSQEDPAIKDDKWYLKWPVLAGGAALIAILFFWFKKG